MAAVEPSLHLTESTVPDDVVTSKVPSLAPVQEIFSVFKIASKGTEKFR